MPIDAQPAPARDLKVQMVHLAILDARLDQVVMRETAAGWLLPFLRADVRERVISQAERLVQSLGIEGAIIHDSRYDFGSDDGTVHAYMAVVCDDATSRELLEPFHWCPVTHLHTRAPLLQEQAVGLAHALRNLREPVAPFDAPSSHAAVCAWVAQQVEALSCRIEGPPIRYRHTRWDSVQAFQTTRGAVYFKGGPDRMASEATVTQALAAACPGAFAATLAIDQERGWWLAEGVPGSCMHSDPIDATAVEAVAIRLAQIQATVANDSDVHRSLADQIVEKELPPFAAEIHRLVPHIMAGAPDASQLVASIPVWCRVVLGHISSSPVPASWLHTDLATPNIVSSPTGVAFIDLEDSMLGAPPLALWRFIVELQTRGPDAAALIPRLVDAYVDAWPATTRAPLRASLAYLPAVGSMLDAFITHRRLLRKARRDGLDVPSTIRHRALLHSLREMATICESGWESGAFIRKRFPALFEHDTAPRCGSSHGALP